jgi:hypothetical protein
MFDVRYHDHRGKLVVTATGVNFEDVSDADHSRKWTYAQIKELKRDGNEIKIRAHRCSSHPLVGGGPKVGATSSAP